MRQAAIEDCWRHISRRNKYDIIINSISFSGSSIFHDDEIRINSAITSICGKNGIGKTSFLRIMEKAIAGVEYTPALYVNNNSQGFSVSIKDKGVDKIFKCDSPEKLNNVEYFDPSSFSLKIIDEINISPDKNGWFNTSTPYEITGEELHFINRITGKKYSKVEVKEVDSIIDDVIFPYFNVTYNSVEYNTDSMGQGEHKILVTIWKLLSLERNTILFLEEPESFICPASQKRFMDFLAYIASIKKLHVIISTHSEHITTSQGLDSVFVLCKKGSKYSLNKCSSEYLFFNALGLNPHKNNVFLVEDEFAKLSLERILQKCSMDLFATSYIHSVGGESNIQMLSRHYTGEHEGINIVAVYDADQLGVINDFDEHISKVFLPSENFYSPEEEVIDFIKSNWRNFCIKNSFDEDLFESEVLSLEVDKHDFFIEACKALNGVDLRVLKIAAIDIWIENNLNMINEFIFKLKNVGNTFDVDLANKVLGSTRKATVCSDCNMIFDVAPAFDAFESGKRKAKMKHDHISKKMILVLI